MPLLLAWVHGVVCCGRMGLGPHCVHLSIMFILYNVCISVGICNVPINNSYLMSNGF